MYLKKIKKRYKKFQSHPLTKAAPVRALFRYLYFNILHSLNNKPRVYKWVNDLKFYAQKGDAGIVPNIYFKLFDYEDSKFILNNLDKSDLFVDVGANVGHFSLLAACAQANVTAIEPIPSTFKKLEKNIQLNKFQKQITTFNIGVGNKKDFLWFSNGRGVMNSVVLDKTEKTEKVEVLTLDSILENDNPKIIKIDVEGFEYFVLEGAKKTLQNNALQFILIELNSSSEKFGKTNEDIHGLLIKANFYPVKYRVNDNKFIEQKSFNTDSFNTLYKKKC